MRTLEYTLNNFHIKHTVVLIIFIVLYCTFLVLIYNWKFDLLTASPESHL